MHDQGENARSSVLASATHVPAPSLQASAPSSVTAAPPVFQRPQTRLQHGIRKPKIYADGTVRYGYLATASEEPTNLHDAMSNPH
jgi:hypothetical protein